MGLKSMFTESARSIKAVTITVDGVENTVYVGKLSSIQMKKVMQYVKDQDGPMANAYMVQVGTYDDEQGTRSFGDTKDDLDAVLKAPIQFVKAVADEVFGFNNISIEDGTKNS